MVSFPLNNFHSFLIDRYRFALKGTLQVHIKVGQAGFGSGPHNRNIISRFEHQTRRRHQQTGEGGFIRVPAILPLHDRGERSDGGPPRGGLPPRRTRRDSEEEGIGGRPESRSPDGSEAKGGAFLRILEVGQRGWPQGDASSWTHWLVSLFLPSSAPLFSLHRDGRRCSTPVIWGGGRLDMISSHLLDSTSVQSWPWFLDPMTALTWFRFGSHWGSGP